MIKSELVEKLYEELGLTKKDIAIIIDEVIASIRTSIIDNQDSVKISGFGKFEVKTRGRRIGRNIRTNEMVVIEPRQIVRFCPSKLLKSKINGSEE